MGGWRVKRARSEQRGTLAVARPTGGGNWPSFLLSRNSTEVGGKEDLFHVTPTFPANRLQLEVWEAAGRGLKQPPLQGEWSFEMRYELP